MLTPAGRCGKSSYELRLMRNELFARHGYIFKSVLLTRHFKSFDWYSPTKTNVDAELTPDEKANVELLASAEKFAAAAELDALPPEVRAFWCNEQCLPRGSPPEPRCPSD